MNECRIVRDLWPLYLDGELSEESKSFVSGHLQGCASCREWGAGARQIDFKQALGDPDVSPGEAEKFLLRLKRRLQLSAAGLIAAAVLLALIGFLIKWGLTDYRAQKEAHSQAQAERALLADQLASLHELSSRAEAALEELGIDYYYSFKVTASGLPRVNYSFSWPEDSPVRWVDKGDHLLESGTFIDADTGKEISWSGTGSFTSSANSARGSFTFSSPVEASRIRMRTAPLYVSIDPGECYSYRFSYRGGAGIQRVDEKLSIRGVEFQIDELVLSENEFKVIYRQLTPALEAGFYQLSFVLDDGLGSRWDDWPRLSLNITDPRQHRFSYIHSLSDSWSLSVGYLVKVIPGFEGELLLED